MHMHAYTLYSAIRPFGVSILLGSYEKDGAHLYVVEPSGMYYVRHHAFVTGPLTCYC